MRATVLGLGEAGQLYARDLLAAGWRVRGFDPAPVPTPDGLLRAASVAEAVADAELVLGLTGAGYAAAVAEQASEALPADACFADFNSAAPETKRAVEKVLAGRAIRVADVAVLAPVPRRGAATPLLISGPGAEFTATRLREVGAEVEVLAGPVGAAATRKLLRSVFMKGLAATVLEALSAGRAAGCEDWLREQIAAELHAGRALIDRLVDGSIAHAGRRIHEVEASRDLLDELDIPHPVCDATLVWLRELATSPVLPGADR